MKDATVVRKSQSRSRRGITLIEMLFSIAILLIGMVGIASVLGVAGRNAVRSRTLTESQIVANNAMGAFLSHEMNRKSLWVPVGGAQYTGVCIDPLWIGNGAWFGPNSANPTNRGMVRVGVKSPDSSIPSYSSKMYEKLFSSADELSTEKGADSTVPVTRLFESFLGGGTAMSSKQELYSWFATIPWVANENPHSKSNNSSNGLLVSIVVVKNRDRREVPLSLNIVPVPPNTDFSSEVGGALRVSITNLPSGVSLKSGDWLMLSRRDTAVPFDSWYRVLSFATDPSSAGGYNATLAGREVPAGTTSLSGTFVSGVVFVSERIAPVLP